MSDILIARQPAFDRAGSAVGYELRFRPVVDEGDPFARSYVSGSFEVLRSGLRAYVRCTRPSHGRVRRRTGGGLRPRGAARRGLYVRVDLRCYSPETLWPVVAAFRAQKKTVIADQDSSRYSTRCSFSSGRRRDAMARDVRPATVSRNGRVASAALHALRQSA